LGKFGGKSKNGSDPRRKSFEEIPKGKKKRGGQLPFKKKGLAHTAKTYKGKGGVAVTIGRPETRGGGGGGGGGGGAGGGGGGAQQKRGVAA